MNLGVESYGAKDYCIEGDKIYYLRMQNEQETGVQLWRMETDGTQQVKLMQEVACAIDYDENWIYYIDADNYDIYKASTNGSDTQKIIECDGGDFIKVLGEWIYYSEDGQNAGIYRMKKDGSNNTLIADNSGTDDSKTLYSIFDQWLLSFSLKGISAIKFGNSSKTHNLTYDIISEWPYTEIYE